MNRIARWPILVGLTVCWIGCTSTPVDPALEEVWVDHQIESLLDLEVQPTQDVLDPSYAIPDAGTYAPAVRLSDDGRRVLVGTSTGELVELDASSREVLSRRRLTNAPVVALEVLGDRLVWASQDGVLEARRDGPGTERGVRLTGVEVRGLAIAPGGRLLAVATGDRLELRRLPGLERIRTLEESVVAVAWDSTGERLAGVGPDGLVVLDRDLRLVREVETRTSLNTVAWSPDGTRVAYGGLGLTVDLLQVETGGKNKLCQLPFEITTLKFSPDGSRLAIGDESCHVRVLEVETRKLELQAMHHLECWVASVAWHDDRTLMFGCRPNDLAPQPSLMVDNLIQEAALSDDIRALGEQERALVELLCPRSSSPVPLERSNILDDPVPFFGSSMGSTSTFSPQQVEHQVRLAEALAWCRSSRPDPVRTAISWELSRVRSQRRALLKHRVQELRRTFRVNVFRVPQPAPTTAPASQVALR